MISRLLASARGWVDESFEQALSELQWHPQVSEMSRHVLLGGGKALRPALVYWAWAQLTGNFDGKPPRFVRDWALALEMIHTYSLVHDDLPAMDNDSFRRGRPTLHVIHSDAAAILAGDALLTGAFEVLSLHVDSPTQSAKASREIARAAGGAGMVSGQIRDMFELAQPGAETAVELARLEKTHREKTGALFGAALALGSIAADVSNSFPERHERVRAWGTDLGLLFQVVDDILDVTASKADLGKTSGKDEASGKRTYVSLLGLERAHARAESQKRALIENLSSWSSNVDSARELLDYFTQRKA